MLSLVHREDVNPVCPFCSVELHDILYQELSGLLGRRFIYFCPGCRGVLGISHRKGFWMG